jgi:hypothetical protein
MRYNRKQMKYHCDVHGNNVTGQHYVSGDRFMVRLECGCERELTKAEINEIFKVYGGER